MNGAESLVRTLLASGVDTCFANPGTSEMHFVAALDRVPGMRGALCLHETVATGAADGYARVTGAPAATLLHCGPGLANGLANLHNARRAGSALVNCVGDQATFHKPLDPPLAADAEGFARGVSAWVRTSQAASRVGADAAAAVRAARSRGGQVATLILPSDTCWDEGGVPGMPLPPEPPAPVPGKRIEAVRAALDAAGGHVVLVLGGLALGPEGLAAASRISAATSARVFATQFFGRLARGHGRLAINRVPYPLDQARRAFADASLVVLAGAPRPVGFFAYPGQGGTILADGLAVLTLAEPGEDSVAALLTLAELVGGPETSFGQRGHHPHWAKTLAATLPDDAIVVDEGLSLSQLLFDALAHAPSHDWLMVPGGAIGEGIPLATGAAIGAAGRRVLCLQADGSGMYSLQGLWTQARERLDVTTVVLANRRYAVLQHELAGVGAEAGPVADALMRLDDPALDWVSLARGMGVEAAATDDPDRLADLLRHSYGRPGPFLIEWSLP